MERDRIEYTPIGIIYTPFEEAKGTPIQPTRGRGIEGRVELFPEYQEGLRDLDGFSHILLIYHLHRSISYDLRVVPFLDTRERGVFATRAPRRPNPVGVSVVRLQRIQENELFVVDLDMLDGTPLLDIKPHVPDFSSEDPVRIGWLADARGNP